MAYLLGLDSGLTVTKAVIFDDAGKVVAVVRKRLEPDLPQPRHVERDMNRLWQQTAAAIAEAITLAGCDPHHIAAVAATAHGDGLYLLNRAAQPLGAGILSLDSRAGGVVAEWQASRIAAAALPLTGQMPHASAPSALLAWLARHDPARFAQIGHILSCKDWLRFCLTGVVGTDLTEASTSFTNVSSQSYDPEIMTLFGLSALGHALPDVADPHEVIGGISRLAAAQTGLIAGTPVVAGLHDVTASALGSGGYGVGTIAVVAGTYSINETVSHQPKPDARWFCRNGLERGTWNNMAISPASATNYDWALDQFCKPERAGQGGDIHAALLPEITAALARPSTLLFHPYLYGSPHGPQASAGFLGLRGWHNRGDMLRAVIEGIAFNHRLHIDALRQSFAVDRVRLTGGISRSPLYAQIFADVLGGAVSVADGEEAAAWGAAICAAKGVGLSLTAAAQGVQTYLPDPVRAAALAESYALHCDISQSLAPLWPRIEALGGSV